jgi:2'-5' RNA ligase
MRADYASDPAMALTSVVFVPPSIATEIRQVLLPPLQAVEPEHHYYPPEAMHLTIKNVRSIHHPPTHTPADIARVHQLYHRLIPAHSAFTVSLEELFSFPTSVALIGYSDERLQLLVQDLDAGLRDIGLADDKQYVSDTVFFGNVTICRFVHPPSTRFFDTMARLSTAFSALLPVQTIHLLSCNAACTPESRTVWHTYHLRD